MDARVEQGFLVLADISGFTSFMTETELEHGPRVVAELVEVIMDSLKSTFTIQELEGDCVFAYGLDRAVGHPATVLDLLEETFVAFKARQRQMRFNTTCTCNACRSIPSLNLKFLTHHGNFLLQSVGGRRQLSGPEIILVHRLLKNTVPGSAYLLLTAAALRRTGVDPAEAGLQEHAVTYDHIGTVTCYYGDLEPAWQRASEARVVRADAERSLYRVECIVPASPAVVWDWTVTPEKRLRYEVGIERILEDRIAGGRTGRGMRHHCDHGKNKTLLTFVDWRPYRYLTMEFPTPLGSVLSTTEYTAEGGVTRMTEWMSFADRQPAWKRWLIRRMFGSMEKYRAVRLARMAELIQEEAMTSAPDDAAANS